MISDNDDDDDEQSEQELSNQKKKQQSEDDDDNDDDQDSDRKNSDKDSEEKKISQVSKKKSKKRNNKTKSDDERDSDKQMDNDQIENAIFYGTSSSSDDPDTKQFKRFAIGKFTLCHDIVQEALSNQRQTQKDQQQKKLKDSQNFAALKELDQSLLSRQNKGGQQANKNPFEAVNNDKDDDYENPPNKESEDENSEKIKEEELPDSKSNEDEANADGEDEQDLSDSMDMTERMATKYFKNIEPNLPEDSPNTHFRVIGQVQQQNKIYNIYKLSDFYIPPTKRVQKQYAKFMMKYINRVELNLKKNQKKIKDTLKEINDRLQMWNIPYDDAEQHDYVEKQKSDMFRKKRQIGPQDFAEIIYKKGESKQDYFLHISKNQQKYIEAENDQKQQNYYSSIYNSVNQVEFYQQLFREHISKIRKNEFQEEIDENQKQQELPQAKTPSKSLNFDHKFIHQSNYRDSTQVVQKAENSLDIIESEANNNINQRSSIMEVEPKIEEETKITNNNNSSNKKNKATRKRSKDSVSAQQFSQDGEGKPDSEEDNIFDEDEEEDDEDENEDEAESDQDDVEEEEGKDQTNKPKHKEDRISKNHNKQGSAKKRISSLQHNSSHSISELNRKDKKRKVQFKNDINEEQFIQDFFQKDLNDQEAKQKLISNQKMEGHLFKLVPILKFNLEDTNFKRNKILRTFDYYNQDIISQQWKQASPLLNYLLLDLNDPAFFLEKVSGILNNSNSNLKELHQQSLMIKAEKNKNEEIQTQKSMYQQDFNDQKSIQTKRKTNTQCSSTNNAHEASDSDNDNEIENTVSVVTPSVTVSRVPATQEGISTTQYQPQQQQQQQQLPSYQQGSQNKTSLQQKIEDFKKSCKPLDIQHIQHSSVAKDLHFNIFKMDSEAYSNYHRPDFYTKWVANYKKFEQNKAQQVQVVIEKQSQNLENDHNSLDFKFKDEKIDSYSKFKAHRINRLSCQKGIFILFEYIEENPLILNNIGMCTKLNRYIYDDRVIANMPSYLQQNKQQQNQLEAPSFQQSQNIESQEILNFKNYIRQQIGSLGKVHFLNPQEKIPLIGQLDKSVAGITIIQNKMFHAPVYKQKAPVTDFLLVREGNQYFLRKLEFVYIVGQIEPQLEIWNPNSRQVNGFFRNCLNTVIKKQFLKNSKLSFSKLLDNFKKMNNVGQIKKAIIEIGGKQATNNSDEYYYSKSSENSEFNQQQSLTQFDIQPEDACIYEKMQNTVNNLKIFGLQQLRGPDKMKVVINKFVKKFPEDLHGYTIAKLIWEELNLTSWNLSQSFISKSKMYLTGVGDPTNGNGGYSYVKKPLKTRTDKDEAKNKEKMDNKNSVTGTDADLRKLSQEQSKGYLLQLGFTEEHINQLNRWQRIELIKSTVSNQNLGSNQILQDMLKKFERQPRITTKMQNRNYQNEINKLFMKLRSLLVQTEPLNFDKQTVINFLKLSDKINLTQCMNREKPNWEEKKQKFLKPKQTKQDAQQQQTNNNEEEDNTEENEDDDEEEESSPFGDD